MAFTLSPEFTGRGLQIPVFWRHRDLHSRFQVSKGYIVKSFLQNNPEQSKTTKTTKMMNLGKSLLVMREQLTGARGRIEIGKSTVRIHHVHVCTCEMIMLIKQTSGLFLKMH